MEGDMGVHVPANGDHGEGAHQDKERGVSDPPHSTVSSMGHVVSGAKGFVRGSSHKAPRRHKSSHAAAYKGVAWKAGVNAAARLDIVQRAD